MKNYGGADRAKPCLPGRHPSCSALQLALCLLYTSDAADERSSVDLGGRRIIKKKNKKRQKKKKKTTRRKQEVIEKTNIVEDSDAHVYMWD